MEKNLADFLFLIRILFGMDNFWPLLREKLRDLQTENFTPTVTIYSGSYTSDKIAAKQCCIPHEIEAIKFIYIFSFCFCR